MTQTSVREIAKSGDPAAARATYPATPGLTGVQQAALDFIKGYMAEHGRSPAIRDIMTGLAYKSPAPVQSVLDLLEQKNLLTWTRGEVRSIRLTGGHKLVYIPNGHSVEIVPPGFRIELVPVEQDEQKAS